MKSQPAHDESIQHALGWWLSFVILMQVLGAGPLLASHRLTGQDTLKLDTDVHYLKEPAASLTFPQTQSLDFPETCQGDANFGWTNVTYWLRTDVIKSDNESYIFEVGYPLLDELDIYIQRDGELVAHHGLGDQQTGIKRLRNAIKPAFEFPREPGAYRVTLRVHSSSSVQVPMALHQETHYHNKMLEDYAYLFSYVGAVFILLLYNFFIFLETRSRSYFYYVCFTGLFLALQVALNGFGQNFIWPESWSNFIIGHMSFLLNVFVYQFSRHFLDLSARPKFERAMRLFAGFAAGTFFLFLFVPYGISVRFMAIMTLMGVSFLLCVATILSFFDHQREAKFYLLAWSSMIIGCIIYLSKQLGLLPYNQLTHNAFMIGSITEITLLSLALGDRFTHLQKKAREAQKARAEAEAELSLSLKTRVYLVSDMAHRMNNPLNYISTYHANLQNEIEDLKENIFQVIREWQPVHLPDLGRTVQGHFGKQFDAVKQCMEIMEDGLRRSASSVVAIRQLSGVDGYQMDRIPGQDLLELVRSRVAESAGESALQRLELINELGRTEVYANRFAVPMVVDLIFKNWLDRAADGRLFTLQMSTGPNGKAILLLQAPYAQPESARLALETMLPFWNQILRPYESLIRCEERDAAFHFVLEFKKERALAPVQEVA